jgi:hypothetical protein
MVDQTCGKRGIKSIITTQMETKETAKEALLTLTEKLFLE